jgi:hypothetical protein
MSRADLLALTPEAIASLSNMGLVKRAQRELADGLVPELIEESGGTVIGTFADGVVARLVPNNSLKETPCSCGANGICRHRIAVALAYPVWHAQHTLESSDLLASAPLNWSPGDIDDAALLATFGAKAVERAHAQVRKGVLATLEVGAIPSAQLPSCSVRFLVPADIAYARCDCALSGGSCEHIALAVWAFRQISKKAPRVGQAVVVRLGSTKDEDVNETSRAAHAVEALLQLVRDILLVGVRDAVDQPARFAELRIALEKQRMTWLNVLCTELQVAIEGYQKRSALYGTREIVALLVEMAGRIRSARALSPHELPARFVLGEDQAPETLLDHVRLVSLGVRLRADEQTRFAEVYLADPDTASVLVLRKRWDYSAGVAPENGPQLARKAIAARLTLQAVATGQMVSKVVKRQANHAIELGVARSMQTSVTPQTGDFGNLPAPLLVKDLATHAVWADSRPPRILRPRVLAAAVHVVAVSEVRDVFYRAAEQELVAELFDLSGHAFTVTLTHRRVAPYAIEAAAAALRQQVRYVAGDLTRYRGNWRLEPIAITADSLHVLDIAPEGVVHSLESASTLIANDPLQAVLVQADAVLEELCHVGLRARATQARPRLLSVIRAPQDIGFAALGARFAALDEALRGSPEDATERWLDAALRLMLVHESTTQ